MTTPNPTSELPKPTNQANSPETVLSLRTRTADQILTILKVILPLVGLGILSAILQIFSWQIFALSASFFAFFVFLFVIPILPWSKNLNFRMMLVVVLMNVVLVVMAGLVQGIGLQVAVISLLISLLISASTMTGKSSEWAINIGLVGSVAASFLGTFSPVQQIAISVLQIIIPAGLGILAMVFTVMVLNGYIIATLRIKLISGALALALIPLIALSIIENSFVQSAIRDRSNQALLLGANQVAGRVDQFITLNLDTITREASLPVMGQYLDIDPTKRAGSAREQELILTFETLQAKQSAYAPSYALLDVFGDNVYDTSPYRIGQKERTADYYLQALRTGKAYITSLQYLSGGKDPYIYFSSPVTNSKKQIVGVLRARYDARILQSILNEYMGLIGARSYPILIDDYQVRLADTITPNQVYKSLTPYSADAISTLQSLRRLPDGIPVESLSTNMADLAASIQNYRVNPYFSTELSFAADKVKESGVAVRLQNKPWLVLVMQEQTGLLVVSEQQTRLSVLIATLIAGLVGVVATIIATLFSNPIVQLTNTAEKVAVGDLSAQAPVTSNDEVGTLSNAFNLMTTRLRTLINELEDRVNERTKELAAQNETLVYRGQQLKTVSDVARGVVSTHNLEDLLTTVTTLISERFNFYHVGIFLIDEKHEFAVLRAANSIGGKRMLARQHRLKVGQVGIVGFVTGEGQPRITTDVGQDAVFFNNPDLPLTRSEMALPLKNGDVVIGALDVQSTESNAFSEEDIELFETLADQVAVAILNSTLYADTTKALEESKNLHRQYLRQEWGRELTARKPMNFIYTSEGTLIQSDEDVPEVESMLHTGVAVVQASQGDRSAAFLAVPIILRGETIGIIRLQDRKLAEREWSDDELTIVQAVADQVALALENARLFETTVRRADRERKVLEITSKIRSTNDPQQMLQIAVEELQRVLGASRTQIMLQLPEPPSQPIPEMKIPGGDGSNHNGHLPA